MACSQEADKRMDDWRHADDSDVLNYHDTAYDCNDPEAKYFITETQAALERCLLLLPTSEWAGWKETANFKHGDASMQVYCRTLDGVGKVYGSRTTMSGSPLLWIDTVLNSYDAIPSWYTDIKSSRIVKRVSDRTDLLEVKTQNRAGNTIRSRQYINARTWRKSSNTTILCEGSVDTELAIADPNCIRAQTDYNFIRMTHESMTSGSEVTELKMDWICHANLNGKLPQSLIDVTMKFMMFNYVKCLLEKINPGRNVRKGEKRRGEET